MTHEFTFPGGSAIITTTSGGTAEAPDFYVSGPNDDEDPFEGSIKSVFAAEILRLANPTPCQWREEENGPWDTGCGGTFGIDDGKPSENRMRFCCYCGHPLEEVPWTDRDDEEIEDVHD